MALIRESAARISGSDAIVLDLGDLAAQAQHLRHWAATQAQEIIAKAQRTRDAMLAEAAKQGKEQGYEDGYARGLIAGEAAGREEGLAAARQANQGVAQAWSASLDELTAAREELLIEARADLLSLVNTLVARVVHQVVAHDPDVARRQLESLLPLIVRPTAIRVYIHPQDTPTIAAVLDGVKERLTNVTHAAIVEDATLARGSCIVTTAGGATLDGSVSTQLDRIAAALGVNPEATPAARSQAQQLHTSVPAIAEEDCTRTGDSAVDGGTHGEKP